MVSIVIVLYLCVTKPKYMKPVLIYENNFYPYNGSFIPQGGDNLFLDYLIDNSKFFLVKFRTVDLANNQIIISIVKI